MYRIEYSISAQKEINKLDKKVRERILKWIKTNIDGCDNPRTYGKALQEPYKPLWR